MKNKDIFWKKNFVLCFCFTKDSPFPQCVHQGQATFSCSYKQPSNLTTEGGVFFHSWNIHWEFGQTPRAAVLYLLPAIRLLQSCGTPISTLVSLITVGEENVHQSSRTGSQIMFPHISLPKASHRVLSPLEGYEEGQSSRMPRREGVETWVNSTNG